MKKKRMKSYLNRALALNLAVMLGMTAAGCGKEAIWENMGKQDVSAEYAESVQDMEAMAATGRYVEQFADLPENSGGPGQAMALLEEGKLAYFDGHTSCYSAEVEALFAEDADWKMIQDFPELKETYIGHSAIAKDGSLALICEEFTEEDIKVTLYVTDSVQNEYKIDGKFTDGDYIGRLFWKEPGELYGVSVRGRVCQINLQEQKMEQLFLGSGSPETLAFSENMLFALENEGIEIFDLSTKEKVESDSVLDEFCKEQFKGMLGASSGSVGAILMPQKDDILYLACESGLYRHVLGGAAIEEVMDGQMSVLGDPMTGLCNMEALADGTFVLLYTGGKMVRIVYDPDASAFPEQQLNVYSLYENDRIRQAIQLYGQKNPQVYVNYEIGIPDESGVTLEDAQKNLNMELLGEEGPDLILLDGLDAESYQKKGMFADLTKIVENFSKESDILDNLLEACKTDGKLYEIPAQIKIPMIFGKTDDLENVTDLASLASLVEKIRTQNPEGGITGSFHAKQELAQLLSLTGESFVENGQIDKEALTLFLQQAQRITAANMSGLDPAYTEMFGQYQKAVSVGNHVTDMMVGLGQISYGMAYSVPIDIGGMDALLKEGGYQMQQWSQKGKSQFLPVNRLAVSASASHPEETAEFLELMFSEEMQNIDLYDGFPVNEAAWEELCRPRKEGDADYICMGGSFRMPDGSTREYYSEWPRAEIMEQMRSRVMELNFCIRKNVWLEEVILQHGPNALLGAASVEETVEVIARSAAIYLAE